MLAELVSVASPGSSDGGSEPKAIVIVWFAAGWLPPPVDDDELLLLLPPPPPQPAAITATDAISPQNASRTVRPDIGESSWCCLLGVAPGLSRRRFTSGDKTVGMDIRLAPFSTAKSLLRPFRNFTDAKLGSWRSSSWTRRTCAARSGRTCRPRSWSPACAHG